MNLTNKISVFKNYYKPDPSGEVTIARFCEMVKSGSPHVDRIRKIRNPETSGDARNRLKSLLPAVTTSGLFVKRNKHGLINHSGFICIDIDGKGNPGVRDWASLRDEMMRIKNVLLSALSVSSKGVFLIIPLACPDRHLSQFRKLQSDFEKGFEITIDPACSDICRLRSISYDPDAKYNPDAIPYKGLYAETPKCGISNYSGDDDIHRLLEQIEELGMDITSEYKDWFVIGCALANEFGEAGSEIFHQISRFYPEYTRSETDHQFDKCLQNGYGFTRASVFYIAARHGITI